MPFKGKKFTLDNKTCTNSLVSHPYALQNRDSLQVCIIQYKPNISESIVKSKHAIAISLLNNVERESIKIVYITKLDKQELGNL